MSWWLTALFAQFSFHHLGTFPKLWPISIILIILILLIILIILIIFIIFIVLIILMILIIFIILLIFILLFSLSSSLKHVFPLQMTVINRQKSFFYNFDRGWGEKFLSVCLSIHPYVPPSISQSDYSSIILSVSPSIRLSIYSSICLSIYLGIYKIVRIRFKTIE